MDYYYFNGTSDDTSGEPSSPMLLSTESTNDVAAATTTTTTPPPMTLITMILPFLLITLSSILLDVVLCYETHLNRCKCQVWMWLAFTLTALSVINDNRYTTTTNNNNYDSTTEEENSSISTSSATTRFFFSSGFLVWGHVTIFGNLVVIFLEGLRIQQHRRRRIFLMIKSHEQFKHIQSFLKLIPIASWTVMIVEALLWVVTMSTKSFAPSSSSSIGGHYYPVQIFLIALVSLWLIRWNDYRQEKIRQELQGIPISDQHSATATTTTTSFSNGNRSHENFNSLPSRYSSSPSSSSCNNGDESVWYTWDCHQVIQWIEQQLHASSESIVSSTTASSTGVIRTSTQNDYDSNFHNTIMNHDESHSDELREERDMILSILIPQRITGDVLDGLTVDQLMAMKVPFGPACRLASKIAYRLVEKYPKPLNMTPTMTTMTSTINRPTFSQRQDLGKRNNHDDDIPSWLAQHDREYNSNDSIEERNKGGYPTQNDRSADAAATATAAITNPYSNNNFNSDHNQHQQRMEKIMRDRFGLELPKVNTTGTNDATVNGDTRKATAQQQHVDEILLADQNTTPAELLRPFNSTQNDHQQRQPYRDDPAYFLTTEYAVKDEMNSFPNAILDQMPRHIQEIAHRRPDLVYQLIQQNKLHHQQLQPQPQHENLSSNTSSTNNLSKSVGLKSTTSTAKGMVPNFRMTTIAESSEPNKGGNRSQSHLGHAINGDREFLSDGEDEDDGDDERTSLIQPPKSTYSSSAPLEYKSIDGLTGDKDRRG